MLGPDHLVCSFEKLLCLFTLSICACKASLHRRPQLCNARNVRSGNLLQFERHHYWQLRRGIEAVLNYLSRQTAKWVAPKMLDARVVETPPLICPINWK